jgi:hypothetical protein
MQKVEGSSPFIRSSGSACKPRASQPLDIPPATATTATNTRRAVGRGKGKGLERGHPRGWKADVRYVSSSENRSHGASLGNQLEPFCSGTRFRYVFR